MGWLAEARLPRRARHGDAMLSDDQRVIACKAAVITLYAAQMATAGILVLLEGVL